MKVILLAYTEPTESVVTATQKRGMELIAQSLVDDNEIIEGIYSFDTDDSLTNTPTVNRHFVTVKNGKLELEDWIE